MYRPLRSLLILLFVVWVLVLPSMGPLMDHHYAERQPGHLHLGLAGYHTHSYGEVHFHVDGPDSAGTGGFAMFAYEGSPAPAVAAADAFLDATVDFEPGSLFDLPPPPGAGVVQHYPSPQDRPPRLPL